MISDQWRLFPRRFKVMLILSQTLVLIGVIFSLLFFLVFPLLFVLAVGFWAGELINTSHRENILQQKNFIMPLKYDEYIERRNLIFFSLFIWFGDIVIFWLLLSLKNALLSL